MKNNVIVNVFITAQTHQRVNQQTVVLKSLQLERKRKIDDRRAPQYYFKPLETIQESLL